ncbi:MAG: RNA polymerase sigma factor, partial [Evtepia sp.]
IRAMPEQYRTILELKFVLEWRDKDIARYVGLSESAVSTRITRGRKLLQEALRKEGYVYE